MPVSASKSPVSLAILNFLIKKFSVWVSPTPTPRTKISIDVPVDRIPDIKSRLEAGMSSRPPGQPRKDLLVRFSCISCFHDLHLES